ncbi:hypothetical protein QFC22_005371 [Naganishia vaughanmartiniae]|uniref:Uncharacterized protein n=1 Tax=Naganishia vaughanmartiniae TaxID=1424756 RepID=A0ACC2WTF5_9TREE|nr:hypothetical protein QFC22_005371 [Naganishia vaughanmartiniae]
MAPGEERVDVDSLKKGKHAYPPGSYIGGELIVLNAKAASEPLVFHLSTKSRQGRSNLVIQCGRFPAELNGNSILEEAYLFLESRFRQYIRIQADFEGLEVLDVVTTKGKPKRIDIRYGVGGAILAQDGGVVHIVNDTVASWFPSQESSEEARAQESAGNHSATKTPPAAKNSPLAAFPTSPPTSEPPMPVGQRELDTSNLGRVRKSQSREVDLQSGRTSHKKFKTESVSHDGKVMDVSSATSAHKQSLPETNSKPVSRDRQSVTRRKSIEAVSGGASRRSIVFDLAAEEESLPSADAAAQITSEPHEPISADVISGGSTRQVVSAKGVRISQLLANPMLLGSLSLDQREALRQAAEQKWLQRNPLFTPHSAASVGSELPSAQKPQVEPGLRSTEVMEAVKPVPKGSNAYSSWSAATESNSSALAAKGGLDVPRTPTTGNVIYPSVERMHSWDASVFVNILAAVNETKGSRSMGQRGDILHRLRLVDPSHPYDGPWLSLFTRGEERRLPTSIPPGSVVLVRGAKLHRENYIDLKCPAHAGWTFSLLIPDASGNPQFVEGVGKRHVDAPPLSRIERDKMSELQRWYFAGFPAVQEVSESGNDVIQNFLQERMSRRATTWSLVKDRDFCDLTVEVLHVRQAQYSTKREFIVTDYTKNDSFTFSEYSTTDIPEVGYITLLTLWDGVALSADLNVINDGDIVTFLNVNIKANSSRYGMEGNVREASGPNGVLYRRFRVLNPQADPLAIELMRQTSRSSQGGNTRKETQRSDPYSA